MELKNTEHISEPNFTHGDILIIQYSGEKVPVFLVKRTYHKEDNEYCLIGLDGKSLWSLNTERGYTLEEVAKIFTILKVYSQQEYVLQLVKKEVE